MSDFVEILEVSDVKISNNAEKTPYKTLLVQQLSIYAEIPGMDKPIKEVVSNSTPRRRNVFQGQDGLFDVAAVGKATKALIKPFEIKATEVTFNAGTDREVTRTIERFTGVQWYGESDEQTIRRYGHTPRNSEASQDSTAVAEAEANRELETKAVPN
jgi:hypothetical protein